MTPSAVWTLSQSRQVSADLSAQVDRFRAEVQTATTTAMTAIGEQVATVTEPDKGVLASAVEREVVGLKKAVAEAFDANDKSSALSRIEESVGSVAAASKAQTVEAVRQVLNRGDQPFRHRDSGGRARYHPKRRADSGNSGRTYPRR